MKDRERYQRDKKRRQEAGREWKNRQVEWMRSLKTNPCMDCGNIFHPAAMQWDHRPGEEKVGNISELVQKYSKARILEEIAKCDLVCANCHAVRTFDRNADFV